MNISNKLKQILEKEIKYIDNYIIILKDFRDNIIKNDKNVVDNINKKLYEIEVYSKEFSDIDKERTEITKELCKDKGINNNIKDIVDYYSKEDEEIAINLANFVDKIQDLALLMDSLKEVIDFQSNLNNLFFKLVNIEKTGKSTYNKNGYSNTIDKTPKDWRG